MSRSRLPSQRFMTNAHATPDDVLETVTSKSLRQVLRAARASGALALAGRKLRELPVESYAPTPDDLEESEKFWEIVELKSFDCSHNLLDVLPSDWRALSTLRQLRVARNALCTLPEALLSDLPALELLDAGDNQLRCLPPIPAQGCALKTLLAPRNALTKMEQWNIQECSNLETLSLSDNEQLQILPPLPKLLRALDVEHCSLHHLEAPQFLETLAAARNELQAVDVGGLQRLKYLDLRQNGLGPNYQVPSLPALAELFLGHNSLSTFDLKPSPALTMVEVASNALKTLPEALGRCINLRAIDASNNNLAELPCSLGSLPKLQRLVLDGNPLRSVRRDIIERGCDAVKAFLRTRAATPATQVTDSFDPLVLANNVRDPDARGVFDLAGKHLRHWPLDRDVCAKVRDSLAQDEGLDAYVDDAQKASRTARVRVVDVSENALSALPEASCFLALGDSLKELRCARNRLRTPPLIGLANVPLKVLNASRNEITNDDQDAALPDGALAKSLQELDLSGNRLLRVPRCCLGLHVLRSLSLARNELSGDLGRGWASLLSLETLNLADNRLGAMGDVHKAPALTTLDLGNNCLRSVPPELGLCDCLRSLVLHGNPQRAIRAETLPKDTLKVLARLRDRLPMDVVERHLNKVVEDVQSIEDSQEDDRWHSSPPPPTGPPPKTGGALGSSTPPPPDGPPPVLSDYAPPSAAARLSSAVDNRACRAMAWSPAPGQGRAMAWSPQDGQTLERKKRRPPLDAKKRKPYEHARAPRPVLSLPSPVLGKGVLPRTSPRVENPKKNLAPSNKPQGLVGRSKPSIAQEDTMTLKGLNERVADLDSRLSEEKASLSQAKAYALKKQLARARADRIRFERALATDPDG